MSWDQGIEERESLEKRSPKFLAWADGQGEKRGWGALEYITWFGSDPDILYLDYGEHGSLRMNFAGTKRSVRA